MIAESLGCYKKPYGMLSETLSWAMEVGSLCLPAFDLYCQVFPH